MMSMFKVSFSAIAVILILRVLFSIVSAKIEDTGVRLQNIGVSFLLPIGFLERPHIF